MLYNKKYIKTTYSYSYRPHRALGVHIDFVRSLTLDSWKPEQITLMRSGGNMKCFNSFRSSNVPMAVTDGGGRNGLVNDLNDFHERYNHVGAKRYKEQLLNEVLSLSSKSTTTIGGGTGNDGDTAGGGRSNNNPNSTTQISDDEKEEIYRLARLDPSLPWYKPIKPVTVKLIALFVQIVFGFPVFPILLTLGFARFILYPSNTLLQGICWLIVCIPLVRSFLFGRYLYDVIMNDRCPSFKSAQNLLAERVIQGRAIRIEGKYDVFLPASSSTDDDDDDDDDDNTTKKRIGLILYPGAMVNHTSYAPIASKISDEGNILVVVMSMEPFRMSFDSVENETKRYLQVMYELLCEVAPNYPVSEWAVGGHSLGAQLAMKVAKATSPGTSKLVLWGCMSRPMDYKSSTLSSPTNKVDVLVLNGSEEKKVPKNNSIHQILPPTNGNSAKTLYRTIPGGNHNGFGHYEKPKNVKKDGRRTITLDEQQRIAVDETVQFLLGRNVSTAVTSCSAVDAQPIPKNGPAVVAPLSFSKKNE